MPSDSLPQDVECQHQREVTAVVAERPSGPLVPLGALVGGVWLSAAMDPALVPLYCEGRRLREVAGLRPGALLTLVSATCLLCHAHARRILRPALVWMGAGSHAPCVRGARGVVKGEGEVWLVDDEREAKCEGSMDVGTEVLVWAWGGRQGEGVAVRGVAVRVEQEAEEQHSDSVTPEDKGVEEEEPHLDLIFEAVFWRLKMESPTIVLEAEERWRQVWLEEGGEKREKVATPARQVHRSCTPPLLPAIPEEEEEDLLMDSGLWSPGSQGSREEETRELLEDFLTFLHFPRCSPATAPPARHTSPAVVESFLVGGGRRWL